MQLKSEVEKGLDEFSNRIWIQLEKLVQSKFKTELSDEKTKLKNIKEIVLTKLRKKLVNPELNQLFFLYCKGQNRVIQNGVAQSIANLIIENWTDLEDIKVHRLDIQDGFNSCQNLIKPTQIGVIPTMVETQSVMGFSNWEMGSHNTIEMRNMVVAHHQMTNRLETENIKAENMVVQTLNQVSNFETTTFTSLEDYERAQIKEEKEFDHLTIEQQSVRSHKKLHYFCERFKQFNPNNEQEPYIPPLGKETRDEIAPAFDVREKVDEFLSNAKKKTLLLLGGPGAGKSLFCKELALDKGESYLNAPASQETYIPIFIQLPRIDSSKLETKLVEEGLRSYLGREVFTPKQLDFLKHHQKLLFIFDGYDEAFPGKGMEFINLSVTNQLHEWEHAKFIFSCRSEDFFGRMKGQKGYFSPQNMPAVYEIHVQSFRPEDIKDYVNRYVSIQENQEVDADTLNWKPETYFDYIFGEVQLKMKIRGLDELVKIPLNLKITMNVLPKIVDIYKQELDEFKLGQITARHLYEAFFEQRFERQEIKRIQQGKVVGISPPEFYANCWAFSMQLAKEMGEESKLVYENTETLSNFRHRLVKFFSDQPLPEDGTTPEERKKKREQWIMARDGCPGRSTPKGGGKYEFAFDHETFKDFLIERLDNEQLESDPLLQALGQEGQINASYSSPVLPKPASASNTEKNTSDTVMSSANTRTLFNS